MEKQTFAMALAISACVSAIGMHNLGAARNQTERQKAVGTVCAGLLVIALAAGVAFCSGATWSSAALLHGKP
ncbi:MAG: hypothetical protein ABF491_14825 [Acetobacter sp.]|uniref:hypothetical protein n=1 Tax=Acetobacter sp. TaxID=440 RepID=UPI0039E777CC